MTKNVNNHELVQAIEKMFKDYAAEFRVQDLEQEAEEAQLAATRASLLATLRRLQLRSLAGQYEGFGDEGNVHSIVFDPEMLAVSGELEEDIQDFIWALACSLDPGFESNEGGNGEVTWDIEEDEISVTHNKHYLETKTTEFEGL